MLVVPSSPRADGTHGRVPFLAASGWYALDAYLFQWSGEEATGLQEGRSPDEKCSCRDGCVPSWLCTGTAVVLAV